MSRLLDDSDKAEHACYKCGKTYKVTLCVDYTYATEPVTEEAKP